MVIRGDGARRATSSGSATIGRALLSIACVLVGIGVAAQAGCTLALSYPPPAEQAEDSDALCANMRDDDEDGQVDCDDLECRGHCTEDTLPRCTNGFDDDGDGRTDSADAGCWPFARVEVQHCSTVPGSLAYLEFIAARERWATTDGSLAPDPTGHVTGDVFVSQVPTTVGAVLDDVFTGRVAGTHWTFDAYVGTGRLTMTLEVADGPVGYHHLDVYVEPGALVARGVRSGQDWDQAVTEATFTPGWYHFDSTIGADDHLRVTVTTAAGAPFAEADAPLTPGGLGLGNAFRVRIEATNAGATTPIVVGRVSLEREPWSPCGYTSPTPDPDWSEAHIAGAVTRGQTVCGVGRSRRVTAWLVRSDDLGATWSEAVLPELGELTMAQGVSLDDDGAYHLAIGSIRDVTVPVSVGTSHDCATLDEHHVLTLPDGWHMPFAGYRFEGGAHEIIQHDRRTPDRWELGRFADDGALLEHVDLGPAQPRASAVQIGNDIVLAYPDPTTPGQRVLAVVGRSLRTRVEAEPFAAITASHHTGTCDELDPGQEPALALDPTPTVDGASATGLLVYDCTVGYATTVPNGVATNRLVVHAR